MASRNRKGQSPRSKVQSPKSKVRPRSGTVRKRGRRWPRSRLGGHAGKNHRSQGGVAPGGSGGVGKDACATKGDRLRSGTDLIGSANGLATGAFDSFFRFHSG